ncbi:MAG TPA: hypothetical protein VFQ85_15270 [Mycobacteriales bacterium]|jgi:hypothetical protein|nr:hypothetical protein [Mycobacteriales bacterium]
MRAVALTLASAAAVAALAAPAAHAQPPAHCDESTVGVLCLDQGSDGTIYQCVVWVRGIRPENNPTCFAIF